MAGAIMAVRCLPVFMAERTSTISLRSMTVPNGQAAYSAAADAFCNVDLGAAVFA